ncbi:hypothetical protein VSDG_03479 [Cytospora chrysosperma]|uniref:Uncharacterized protein n=1 Tax=Cytospora chrysosperma TaxID=252740 RepID=A0A423WA30_CYTCH|nr:hypothetical protein VSDG_03479 [Valsa sordida]
MALKRTTQPTMSLAGQIRTQLQALNLPPPSTPWLQTLVSARSPPPPLPSLVMTAKTRLLASDLTTPGLLDPAATATLCFPPLTTAAATTTTTTTTTTTNNSTSSNSGDNPPPREARLPRDVYVQVLDVEDISRSRWEQVEELESVERGERTRGREVIRLPVNGSGGGDGNGGDEQDDGSWGAPPPPPQPQQQQGVAAGGSSRNATHRLVLQDCKGQKVFAVELVRVPRIGVGTLNIGEKILLKRGTVVARGTVLLEPGSCHILGGKVEAWQKAWLEGRLARLRDTVGPGQAEAAA